MLNLNIPRCPHRKMKHTIAGITDGMPGDVLAFMAKMALPDAGQTRQTLLRLRQAHQFSRGKLAAILAVSPATLRRWESGQRRPCAAARRAVQLVERFYFRPGDFPTVPLESVLSALQADMADKIAQVAKTGSPLFRVEFTTVRLSIW